MGQKLASIAARFIFAPLCCAVECERGREWRAGRLEHSRPFPLIY
jgi:hypothetical protein